MGGWTEAFIALGYPGAFFLGLLGSATIIVPVPTTVALLTMATLQVFDPTLLAVAFGIGAAVGELTGYMVGYAGRRFVGKKYAGKMEASAKIFERYGAPAVFIFALTPLPDDLLFIPLGLSRCPLLKIFAAAVAGKLCMALIIAHFGGFIGAGIAESWEAAAITGVLLLIVIAAMLKIDWEKLAKKYL
ncbi:MAG: VTT domain-containing protein [Candidatus Hadarchaeales archaeon]